jgi:quercetin dioxygenase-like cupin family protein
LKLDIARIMRIPYRPSTEENAMSAPTPTPAPTSIQADVAPITVGTIEIRYLVDGSDAGHSGMFEMTLPPHSNVPPPHSHSNAEEVIYVLEGRIRYSVDGVQRDLGPGDSMFTPRGSVHGFGNPFDEPVRALTVLTPDIGAQYFRDVGTVVNAGGPPDKARLVEVMTRYGLKLAPPPIPAA